ncbi:DUF262 domain-containing protein [Bacillus hominis]|uniref:DUF262 domain-containing protein n=1 Tax=Bacillus hominis TaxID=2817478 RepID=A0ABT7R4D3_9BACI|nr:DUF262 domain-containing protein [Bacillus hominis]MDM5192620.1 DUF262 domain-containing protein [Bacillus hominis]MDM5432346.1 DUF262 domain-containing protein [Bacillus hominis]MDM5437785.1 DUF262 domain-containing protein [Bacillus hominis]
MQKSKVFSFWELIDKYYITIPIIQRDYAQGREGAQHIRSEFLRVLFDALQTNNPTELDFIYGTVNEMEQFAPLDGQQRLTTLFLLHWYFALKEEKLAANQEIFQKFSYETRLSSKQFCKLLVSLTDLDLTKTSLSKQIYNEANFYYGWAHDPTVLSMLTMIDLIHEFASKHNLPSGIFGTLTTKAPITFQFIDLDLFHLEDTLYIKMNSRGKPLTPFENFKARFQQYLESIHTVNEKDILEKIDTAWSDFFWKHQHKSYDESFLHFFYALLYNQLARHNENRNRLFVAINGEEAIRFDELANVSIDDEAWIKNIEVTMNMLCSDELFNQQTVIDIKKLITQTITGQLNYTERVQLYAIVSYISLFNNDLASFERWMRFIRNVTVNTVYNRVEDFMQSIQTIDMLITQAQDINSYLVDPSIKLTGFLGAQITQEQIKAQLIRSNQQWEEILFKAEDYSYFEGDIGFLLQFSNMDDNDVASFAQDDHREKQEIFVTYYEKSIAIFGSTKLNVPTNLLSRALLTFGDYLIQAGQNRSFLIEGFDRDISWKRFLRHENVSYLKELLDEVELHSIQADLQRIINESDVMDWRRYFIKYPSILEERCGKRRFIRFYEDKDILLLDTTMTSGYCQEYYSYAIYAGLKQLGIACSYIDSIGALNDKYVQLGNGGYRLKFIEKQMYIYDENDHVIAEPQHFDEALEKMSELAGISI